MYDDFNNCFNMKVTKLLIWLEIKLENYTPVAGRKLNEPRVETN